MTNYKPVLVHHGILGQKWGRRRYRNEDGTLTPAGKERYSAEQYKRDKTMYGTAGANRINKHVEKGDSVSAARSREARRINTTRKIATTGNKLGSIAGSVGAGIGTYLFANKIINKKIQDPQIAQIISLGASAVAASIGSTVGKVSTRDTVMVVGGYAPNKYRPTY